jgi:SOS-response transcriptional repressor LexA
MLNRDDEYLGRLRDYYAQHRVLPSFTAICRLLGLKSTSSVAAMARRMQETGHLESGDF